MKKIYLLMVLAITAIAFSSNAGTGDGSEKKEIKHYTRDLRLMNNHYRNYVLLSQRLEFKDRMMSADKLNRTGNALLYTGIAATVIGTVMMANADELYYNYNSNTGSDGDAGGAFGLVIATHGVAGIIVGAILKGRANRK